MDELLERRNGRAIEVVFGDEFIAEVPTPFLDELIEHAADVVRAALADACPEALVETDVEVPFAQNTLLWPDIVVRRVGGERPELVIEVRTESTDRYALGPKRLVYSRSRVPEYWFIDPPAHLVRRLRIDAGQPDYPWPSETLSPGDVLEPTMFPGARVAVTELLGRATEREPVVHVLEPPA